MDVSVYVSMNVGVVDIGGEDGDTWLLAEIGEMLGGTGDHILGLPSNLM